MFLCFFVFMFSEAVPVDKALEHSDLAATNLYQSK